MSFRAARHHPGGPVGRRGRRTTGSACPAARALTGRGSTTGFRSRSAPRSFAGDGYGPWWEPRAPGGGRGVVPDHEGRGRPGPVQCPPTRRLICPHHPGHDRRRVPDPDPRRRNVKGHPCRQRPGRLDPVDRQRSPLSARRRRRPPGLPARPGLVHIPPTTPRPRPCRRGHFWWRRRSALVHAGNDRADRRRSVHDAALLRYGA